jgi:hypothetical protein
MGRCWSASTSRSFFLRGGAAVPRLPGPARVLPLPVELRRRGHHPARVGPGGRRWDRGAAHRATSPLVPPTAPPLVTPDWCGCCGPVPPFGAQRHSPVALRRRRFESLASRHRPLRVERPPLRRKSTRQHPGSPHCSIANKNPYCPADNGCGQRVMFPTHARNSWPSRWCCHE